MSRLEVADRSTVGIVTWLFLVICPAVVIGSSVGSVVAVRILPVALYGIELTLAFAIGGLITGAATGLLIRRPLPVRRWTIVAIVVGLLVATAMGTFILDYGVQTTHLPIPWAQLPIPVLVGTAVQVVVTRVIWALLGRTRQAETPALQGIPGRIPPH